MEDSDYWQDCIAEAAQECGLQMTADQVSAIAESVSTAHEHYGMAFYDPGWGDRIGSIEQEWKSKFAALQKDFDEYREGSEIAVKRALKLSSDANIGINKYGGVTRY